MIRILVCSAMATARLIELLMSRRNIRSEPDGREGEWSRRSYPAMVTLHTVVIGGTALLGRSKPQFGWVALLLAVQPLRWWILSTLNKRWNARGRVPRNMAVATNGPYAFVRHPNYTVVVLELLALPAAFGLNRLAAVAAASNAVLLSIRIREEEQLLVELPGYREHFADRRRFLPWLF